MVRAPKIFITRKWRTPIAIIVLFVAELPFTVAALALFGISDPDLYRTRLWQNGADQGFNSSPDEILYAFANYRPIPVPLPWSQFVTSFNVVVSVLSMFILLVKATMFVMHAWIPLLSFLVHALLVVLWAVAVHNQAASDMSDLTKPQPGAPWYLTKGCSYATQANMGYCKQAQASFGVTVSMLALFFLNMCYAIYSMIPTTSEKTERTEDMEMSEVGANSPESEMSREEKWEAQRRDFMNLPKTPRNGGFSNPMTPRTVAFTQLNGGDQGRMGSVGGSTALPFRPQYGQSSVPDAR